MMLLVNVNAGVGVKAWTDAVSRAVVVMAIFIVVSSSVCLLCDLFFFFFFLYAYVREVL